MSENTHICALPGCDNPVEQPEDENSVRMYCSPEHKRSVRRLRQETRTVDEPATPGPAGTRPEKAKPDKSRPATAREHSRLKRNLITTTVVVALAAGSVTPFVVSDPVATPVAEQQAASVPVVTDPVNTAAWATQARQALDAINTQLQDVAKAENALNALPESQRAALSQEAGVLSARRELLAREGATLNAALSAQDQLPTAQANLVAAERQLASVQATLSRGQTDEPSILTAQRDSLQQSVNAMRQGVAGWRQTVDEATHMTLPTASDSADIKELVETTLALAKPDEHPGRGTSSPPGPIQVLAEGNDRSSRRGGRSHHATTAAPPWSSASWGESKRQETPYVTTATPAATTATPETVAQTVADVVQQANGDAKAATTKLSPLVQKAKQAIAKNPVSKSKPAGKAKKVTGATKAGDHTKKPATKKDTSKKDTSKKTDTKPKKAPAAKKTGDTKKKDTEPKKAGAKTTSTKTTSAKKIETKKTDTEKSKKDCDDDK